MSEAEATELKGDMEENENNDASLFLYAHRKKTRANDIPDRKIKEELSNMPIHKFIPTSTFEAALKGPTCVGIFRSSANTHEHSSDEIGSDEHKGSSTQLSE